MLSSSQVLNVIFDEKELSRLNAKRLKAFKKACYSFVGNRFYWCEGPYGLIFDTPETKKEYETLQININLISKCQKKFSND
jgi:hypothetical protein